MAARAKAAGALLLCRPQGAGRDPAVPCAPLLPAREREWRQKQRGRRMHRRPRPRSV